MCPVPKHLDPLQRLIRTGITSQMHYQERRRIIVLNIAGLSGGVCSALFLVANCLNHYTLLCWLDILTLCGGWSVPLFHKYGKLRYPPLIVSTLFSLCAAISSLFYHNHAEFFLLLFLGVNFIVWEKQRTALGYGVFNAVLFFLLQINPYPPLALAVPAWNKGVVLLIGLGLYIYFLYYFKHQTLLYQKHIEQQNEELASMNRHIRKVMSVLSHDIRSPIGNVYTSLMMLRDGFLSREEFDAYANRLLLQVDHLNVNINSLLEWSRSQLNNTQPEPEDLVLRPLMGSVLDFLCFQMDAKEIGIDMSGFEDLAVRADRNELSIILRNLLSNALKFSYRGATVYLSTEQSEHIVRISVQDTGMGMTAAQLESLFGLQDPEQRYGTENEKGNGLGLKLSHDFALRNGGHIRITSLDGGGTTVVLEIPAATAEI